MRLTREQIRYFRLRRAGLIEPLKTPVDVVRRLVGVQAQILPAAGLSLWNRLTSYSFAEFERDLWQKKSLLKVWAQRGTLHLVATDEWPVFFASRSGGEGHYQRRVRAKYGDEAAEAYERLIHQIAALARERDIIGRTDLRNAPFDVPDYALNSWGGIFADLMLRGIVVHAQAAGGEGKFAHRHVWLPDADWRPPSKEAANLMLLRRYLRAYGPATMQDFAYWRGINRRDAKQLWATVAPECVEVDVDGTDNFLLKEDWATLHQPVPQAAKWPIKMLFRFEPVLLPHKDKTWFVPAAQYKKVWRKSGHIEGVVLARGQAVATWRYTRRARGLSIVVYPFKPLPKYVQKAVTRRAQGVATFFDLPLDDLVLDGVE